MSSAMELEIATEAAACDPKLVNANDATSKEIGTVTYMTTTAE
jgi:hypothetical protein